MYQLVAPIDIYVKNLIKKSTTLYAISKQAHMFVSGAILKISFTLIYSSYSQDHIRT